MLDKLGDFEKESFEAEYADQNWYKGKQQKEIEAMEKARKRGKLSQYGQDGLNEWTDLSVVTKDQKKDFERIKEFVLRHSAKPTPGDKLILVNKISARDRRFIQELADSLHLYATWDGVNERDEPVVTFSFDMEGISEDGTVDEQEGDEWESEGDEGDLAIQRVLNKYEKAKIVENTVEDYEEAYEEKIEQKMKDWKRDYYKASVISIESTYW